MSIRELIKIINENGNQKLYKISRIDLSDEYIVANEYEDVFKFLSQFTNPRNETRIEKVTKVCEVVLAATDTERTTSGILIDSDIWNAKDEDEETAVFDVTFEHDYSKDAKKYTKEDVMKANNLIPFDEFEHNRFKELSDHLEHVIERKNNVGSKGQIKLLRMCIEQKRRFGTTSKMLVDKIVDMLNGAQVTIECDNEFEKRDCIRLIGKYVKPFNMEYVDDDSDMIWFKFPKEDTE
jgi:hypothetical protein